MEIRILMLAALLVSTQALANPQEIRQFNCEQAALTEYKKQFDAREAKRLSSVHDLTKPITVQEVLADRRLVEAYCLKQAACDGKPENLGKRFSDCIDQDAIEAVQRLDELNAPDPKDR
ncbi:hypothetical protein [Bradyrhizobium sp. SZCCHNRI2007]|uniref:hypothetical protein n=1 Tax=Bradyrhizobium sp. SZCCHNRI2007 TaxID=3057281 RepID=UPI0028E7C341|nr:hypothetical protein [Bradyrhizobium sp. SZCCHNRI2007]